MENEIRFYLKQILEAMTEKTQEQLANELRACHPNELDEIEEMIAAGIDVPPAFKPQYIITAVKLPTGAIELAVNTTCIKEKIDYILSAYDEEMRLKTNPEICMANIMIV